MASSIFGLAGRGRIPALMQRHDSTMVMGAFAIGIMSGVALVTGGLTDNAPALVEGVAWTRVGAAALSPVSAH